MKVSFVILFVFSAAIAIAQDLPTESSTLFSGSGNCSTCHSAQGETFVTSTGEDISPVSTWRSTMMANAAKDPLWQAKVSAEVEANPHLQSVIEDKCTTCHAPMARTEAIYNGGDAYSFDNAVHDSLGLDGVSCTLCHQVQNDNFGEEDSFSGHYKITDAHDIFGPYANPTSQPMFNQTGFTPVHSPHIKSSELCATCHTLFTPFVDDNGEVVGTFPEQTPYLEWKNSDYSQNGIECQSCHMPSVDEAIKIAATPPWLNTKRQPVWKHDFVGGNTFMVSMLKDNAEAIGVAASDAHFDSTLAKEERLLQQQTIDLSVDGHFENDSLILKVNVKNLAGHKFPTGFPSRRAWLYVEAKNQDKDTIFLSGAWDEYGEIIGLDENYETHLDHITKNEQVQIYESIMQDVNGDVTFTLLRGAEYVKDNRLPPIGFRRKVDDDNSVAIKGYAADDDNFNMDGNGTDIVTYKIPAMDTEYDVSVSMYYQTATPRFVNDLFQYETNQVNVFKNYYNELEHNPILIKRVKKQFSMTSVEDDSPFLPQKFRLTNYPNPFNSSTMFEFHLHKPANISFSIYNTTGQLTSTLVDGMFNAGRHTVRWSGQTNEAFYASSGLYLAVLDVDGQKVLSRILLLR